MLRLTESTENQMQTLPKNIRITAEIDAKIDAAVAKTGLTKAEVMRAAIELGLADLMLVTKSPMERIKDEVAAAKAGGGPPLDPRRR